MESDGRTAPAGRVLVVDDNVDSAEVLAKLLRRSGHDVRTAYTGPTALDVAAESRPDAVLLDIGLPGINGYEVARHLRQNPHVETVKLVAVTGYGNDDDRKRSQEAGFDHHLVKPVEPADLRTLLAGFKPTAA